MTCQDLYGCTQFGEPTPSTTVIQTELGNAAPQVGVATVAQPAPTGSLPQTGANVVDVMGVGALLIVVGLGARMLSAARRRHGQRPQAPSSRGVGGDREARRRPQCLHQGFAGHGQVAIPQTESRRYQNAARDQGPCDSSRGPRVTNDEAIDILARTIISTADDHAEWENFPEIGEYDWERIVDRIRVLTPYPGAEAQSEAYTVLTGPTEPMA